MAKIRMSMVIDGVNHVKVIHIDEGELNPQLIHKLDPDYQRVYRENVIEKHMNKWALSLCKLNYRELGKYERGNAKEDRGRDLQEQSQESR